MVIWQPASTIDINDFNGYTLICKVVTKSIVIIMSKFEQKTTTCPVELTISIIGKKWSVLIIRDLLGGKKRFGELLKSLIGISPRTLSARLRDLEKNGVIKKKIFAEIPLHVEYALTKRGSGLHFILEQMSKWGCGNGNNLKK